MIGPSLNTETAKYVITNVGEKFCELMMHENHVISELLKSSPDSNIIWKHSVARVREMCDSCNTTLFNMHWVCEKCGFVVCLDCYSLKKNLIGGLFFILFYNSLLKIFSFTIFLCYFFCMYINI